MATPVVDRHFATPFLGGHQLVGSNTDVVRYGAVVVPRPTAAALPFDEEDPCGAARGILLALTVCMPFWAGVSLVLF